MVKPAPRRSAQLTPSGAEREFHVTLVSKSLILVMHGKPPLILSFTPEETRALYEFLDKWKGEL